MIITAIITILHFKIIPILGLLHQPMTTLWEFMIMTIILKWLITPMVSLSMITTILWGCMDMTTIKDKLVTTICAVDVLLTWIKTPNNATHAELVPSQMVLELDVCHNQDALVIIKLETTAVNAWLEKSPWPKLLLNQLSAFLDNMKVMVNASVQLVRLPSLMDQDVSPPLLLVDVPKSSILPISTVFHAQKVMFLTEPKEYAKKLRDNVMTAQSLEIRRAATHADHVEPTKSHLLIRRLANSKEKLVAVLKSSQKMELDVFHVALMKLLTQIMRRNVNLEMSAFHQMKSMVTLIIATDVSHAQLLKFQTMTELLAIYHHHQNVHVTKNITQQQTCVLNVHLVRSTTMMLKPRINSTVLISNSVKLNQTQFWDYSSTIQLMRHHQPLINAMIASNVTQKLVWFHQRIRESVSLSKKNVHAGRNIRSKMLKLEKLMKQVMKLKLKKWLVRSAQLMKSDIQTTNSDVWDNNVIMKDPISDQEINAITALIAQSEEFQLSLILAPLMDQWFLTSQQLRTKKLNKSVSIPKKNVVALKNLLETPDSVTIVKNAQKTSRQAQMETNVFQPLAQDKPEETEVNAMLVLTAWRVL